MRDWSGCQLPHYTLENIRELAFVFAVLPSVVDDVVNERVLTFPKRAVRRRLGNIPLPDVCNAYQATVEDSGLSSTRTSPWMRRGRRPDIPT